MKNSYRFTRAKAQKCLIQITSQHSRILISRSGFMHSQKTFTNWKKQTLQPYDEMKHTSKKLKMFQRGYFGGCNVGLVFWCHVYLRDVFYKYQSLGWFQFKVCLFPIWLQNTFCMLHIWWWIPPWISLYRRYSISRFQG